MARLALALLLVVFLTGIPSAVGSPGDGTPVAVIAAKTGTLVDVTWIPTSIADSFNVYGVRDGTFSLIGHVAGTAAPHAQVAAGFQVYAVTAMQSGTESAPAIAGLAVGEWPVCVYADPGPPPIFDVSCLPV